MPLNRRLGIKRMEEICGNLDERVTSVNLRLGPYGLYDVTYKRNQSLTFEVPIHWFGYTTRLHESKEPFTLEHDKYPDDEEELKEILDEEGQRLLDVISKNALKMGRLIDDLLTFSRMSRTEIRKLNVNMRDLADEAWTELAEQAVDRNVQIEFKTLPESRGDRNMLKQVYVNLFSNAIKFSNRGWSYNRRHHRYHHCLRFPFTRHHPGRTGSTVDTNC